MGFDPGIRARVQKLAKTKQDSITLREIFRSVQLKEYLDRIAKRMTEDPNLHTFVDCGAPDGIVGCTDREQIYLNYNSAMYAGFKDLEARFVAFMGVFFHEIAHCVFCDFNTGIELNKSIADGKLYCELPPDRLDDEQKNNMKYIKKVLQNPVSRQILIDVFGELSNIVDDRHDEDALIRVYDDYVGEPIYTARHALRNGFTRFEDNLEAVQTGAMSELSLFYDLLLQMTRFDSVVAGDMEVMERSKYWKQLMKIRDHARMACVTDSAYRKFEELSYIVLELWPYIRQEIEKLQKQNQNSQSQQNRQQNQNGQNQQSQGRSSGGDQGQNNQAEPQSGTQGTDSGNTSGNQSGQGQPGSQNGSGTASQTGNSGNGPQQPLTQEQVQQILNQLGKSSGNMNKQPKPENRSSSEQAKENREKATSGNQNQPAAGKPESSQKQDANGNGQSNQISGLLNSLKQQLAEEKAEKELENEAATALQNKMNGIAQPVIHKNVALTVDRILDVSESDIRRYAECMKELAPYSKRLQKQMLEVLRDLREGYVQKHKAFGNNLVVSDAYRPDQKYFSNKKQPQDLPDMAIYVLVDHSGSMSSIASESGKRRIEISMEAAMLLHDFATKIGIPVAVGGHSANDGVEFKIYTDFEMYSDKDKYRLAKMRTSGCNRDGMALNVAAGLLNERPEEIKLLIIISDGLPNHYGYRGEEAKKDIQEIMRKCKHKNIEVLAAAIGDDKDQVKEIYGDHFIDISDLSLLPKMLTKMVKKRVLASAH